MKTPIIPPDDLIDIIELTQQLQQDISKTLDDQEINVAMSALIGATINVMISQCSSSKQVCAYRNVFFDMCTHMVKKCTKEDGEHP